MSIYVYCTRKSTGALELVRALGATRLRHHDGLSFWDRKRRIRLNNGDVVICWGASIPEIDGVRVLNSLANPVNKIKEIEKLHSAGIPTVTVSTRPFGASYVSLPRSIHHTGALDLLGLDNSRKDFYVLKEDFVKEYRLHSFGGKCIRAGQKVLREGFTVAPSPQAWRPNAGLAHPWIRSYDAGWKISYDNFKSNQKLRALAHSAVKALGLHFGAVDIAEKADGKLKVLEVNRAPGLEGGTVQAYARKIDAWIKGEIQVGNGQEPDVNL